jgi:hypothetical protein
VDSLREELKRRVPSHVIPSVMEAMEEVPTLPSGKPDRQKLKKMAEEFKSSVATTEHKIGDHNDLSSFLDSDEAKALKESGLDSLGLVKLFRQSDTEQRLIDNLYALNMTCIIFYHVSTNFPTNDLNLYQFGGHPDTGTQWLFVPFVSPDYMTMWYIISGYLQGRRSAATSKGGKVSVVMDSGDFALILLWLVMRVLIPLVGIPVWSMLGPLGLFPVACAPGVEGTNPGDLCSGEGGFFSTAGDSMWGPIWYFEWLFLAKIHAVVLSQMRIPPVAQIVILLLLGNLAFLVPGTGFDENLMPDDGLTYDWLNYFIGEYFFWNWGLMKAVATYVAAIYYAQPVVSYVDKLRGSQHYVATAAFLGIVVMMAGTHLIFVEGFGLTGKSLGQHDTTVDILDSNIFLVDGFQYSTPQMFQQASAACAPPKQLPPGTSTTPAPTPGVGDSGWVDQPRDCVFYDRVQHLGPYYLWTIFLWPAVVFCKAVMLTRLPVHLETIGSTTMGAYMIHFYCPIIFTTVTQQPILDALGDIPGAAVVVATILLYALTIQFTVGRLCNYLSLLVVKPINEVCIKTWGEVTSYTGFEDKTGLFLVGVFGLWMLTGCDWSYAFEYSNDALIQMTPTPSPTHNQFISSHVPPHRL